MDCEEPKWCAKCFLRIAPYDSRTVYKRAEYHQKCFLKLVKEEADEERARIALKRAKTSSNQYVKTR